MTISGQIVNIQEKQIFPGEVIIKEGRIAAINKSAKAVNQYIMPGFIDAHVHIESAMLVPSEFARLTVVHGTVATISDPHEVGNVMGLEGVHYMIKNGKKVNFKFYFGAPSCVPATAYETAGAAITAAEIEALFQNKEVKYLAEMMNWPGVLHQDAEVYEKLALAKKYNKNIDGHAPGLKGEQARQYAQAGITTDHECFTREEALDKLSYGMKILIREGSAAKNFEALVDLLPDHAENMMFCSDDKHPDNLVEGHINVLVKRAVEKGIDLFQVLQAACINPVEHYHLEVGLLKAGDLADLIIVQDLKEFKVLKTFVNGELVAEEGLSNIPRQEISIINNFNIRGKHPEDFRIKAKNDRINVIEASDGQLVTKKIIVTPKTAEDLIVPDVENDILKIVVINRYENALPAIAFIKNIGLRTGALASSVAHDSHNIVAVGTDDLSIWRAVNLIIESKGGISAVEGEREKILPLPVAGLMSDQDGYAVAEAYTEIDKMAKAMGSRLKSPFMTLSFMALLVIPSLKLSDKGLFDGDSFKLISVFD